MDSRERIIVALDVPTLEEASPLVRELSPYVGAFKIGLELITSVGGPEAIRFVQGLGGKIFYDGKFSDIPNTVGQAAKALAEFQVYSFDVHANCGADSVKAAVANRGNSEVWVVTVLTSFDPESAQQIFGAEPLTKVSEFARLAQKAGAQGIICSPQEVVKLRQDPSLAKMKLVTPGIRPDWSAAGDQKRKMTPKQAIESGVDLMVIGRPITNPPSEVGTALAAVKRILNEIAEAKPL